MNVEEIRKNDRLFAYIIRCAFGSQEEGIQFFGDVEDFLQVGIMKLNKGKKLKAHYHLPQSKLITKNQEVLIILSGKVEVLFFDGQSQIESKILEGGDIVVLLDGGHGFRMLSDAKLIEVKQGPYRGQEMDKKFIEVNI